MFILDAFIRNIGRQIVSTFLRIIYISKFQFRKRNETEHLNRVEKD